VPDLDSVAIELPYKVPTTFNTAAREAEGVWE
jgi:hypothetical protein